MAPISSHCSPIVGGTYFSEPLCTVTRTPHNALSPYLSAGGFFKREYGITVADGSSRHRLHLRYRRWRRLSTANVSSPPTFWRRFHHPTTTLSI
ncbi:hypothetical protein HRI_001674700 [Hibiscus trionum]|uniref:Uncharacterized protein n=1 Tax=Hibiscus trionum TaxID=183268 RepID=A0A9W7HLK7_HIBTR|nr:hypothetical protein HRI_001674700 [Hibiscus trionum]